MTYRPPIVNGEARVTATEHLTRRVLRVTIAGEALADYRPDRPAEAFRLMLPPSGATRVDFPHAGADGLPQWSADQQRPSLRAFTVRSSLQPGSITFDVMRHGRPTWPSTLQPGSLVGVAGMRHGHAAGPTARHIVLVGDRSALPAIAAVMDATPPGRRLSVVLDVPDPAERALVPQHVGATVRWVADGDDPSSTLRSLIGAEPPDHLYAAGEVNEVAAAYRIGTELGLGPSALQPVVYWQRRTTTDERDPQIYRRYAEAAIQGRDVSDPALIADLELTPVSLPD